MNQCEKEETQVSDHEISKDSIVIYVLGGPGSGKGTQCSNIAAHNYGFCHLSVGELLQTEIDSGSENKAMIEAYRIEGKLLPSDMVISLMKKAMEKSQTKKFLIDGFPRNKENLLAAEKILKIEPEFVLFLDCTKELLISRILNRKQGRADDNLETVMKRLQVYFDETMPVINHYNSKGKVVKVDADQTKEEVFDAIKKIFSAYEI